MADLPHGWTLGEVEAIARSVVYSQRGLILDAVEARDVAACALVGRLYEDAPPSRLDLFRVARSAVAAANAAEYSFAGLDKNSARSGRTETPPGWATYWHGRSALVSPWEEDLIDALAVLQVRAALSQANRETFDALAEHATYEGARTALGLSPKGWEKRIRRAREQARILWHWPEPPSRMWSSDRPGLPPDRKGRNRGLMVAARTRRRRSRA